MRYFEVDGNQVRCLLPLPGLGENEQRPTCRQPTCRAVVESHKPETEARGRRKQFCGRKCAETFARTRVQLDAAIDELSDVLDTARLTARQERAWNSLLRRLLDRRSLYTTPEEYLAVALDDLEHVGNYGQRPTASLIRGWLGRPRPDIEVACQRCSGTGENHRLRRFHPHTPRPAARVQDLRDSMNETLWKVATGSPRLVPTEWFQLVHEWANPRTDSSTES